MTDAEPILVTGAAGLVGSACAAALDRQGFDTWRVARTAGAGRLGIDLSLPFEAGLGTLARGGAGAPPTIIHLAAAIPDARRYAEAEAAERTRAIDRHVCRAARAWGSRMIYMSTCGLYDGSDPSPKTPASPVRASSPYFQAKYEGEQLFGETGAAIFRLASPIGPGIGPGPVMAKFVARSRVGRPIEIWGSGLREQDFIHVADVADLLVSAVGDPGPGIYNCARGSAVTMIELAQEILRVVGAGEIVYPGAEDPNEGETARYAIAATEARFRWSPKLSLAEIIRSIPAEPAPFARQLS